MAIRLYTLASRTSANTAFLNATIHSLLPLFPTTLLQPNQLARAYIMTETRNIPGDGRGGHKQTLNVRVNIPLLMYLIADLYTANSFFDNSFLLPVDV